MSLQSLDNLVKIGQLKIESRNQLEFIGLLRSGQSRLNDAMNTTLAIESRFDLAYNVDVLDPHLFVLQLSIMRKY